MSLDRRLHVLRMRLRTLFLGRAADRDLDDELRFHLEQAAADAAERGQSPDAARRAALVALGGLESRKEECREARGLAALRHVARDLRLAVRLIGRRPGFSSLAIATLAIAIGASTAVFAIVHGVLLQPLPYPDSHRLMLLTSAPVSPEYRTASGLMEDAYLDFEPQAQTVDAIALFASTSAVLTGTGDPARIRRAIVTRNLFAVLGVPPARGRGLDGTFGSDAAAMVVISDHLWRAQLAADPNVVGRVVTLDGVSHQVAGVMPAGFDFPDQAEAWTRLDPARFQGGNAYMRPAVGRLAPGASRDQAEAELASATRPPGSTPDDWQVRVAPLQDRLVGDVRQPLLVLTAAVAFVLLVACVNVANLLLIRMSERRRELTIRAALGAGRGRLVQQLFTESLVLALIAAGAGVLLAALTLPALLALAPAGAIPRMDLIRVDGPVLRFGALLSVATTLVFGALPALRASRRRGALTPGSRTVVEGRERLYRGLVVMEIAVSLILLTGAGLMLRAFLNLQAVDTGFDAARAATVTVDLPAASYATAAEAQRFYTDALEALERLPGIESAGTINWLPFGTMAISGDFVLEGGRVPASGFNVDKPAVSAGYFRAMGIRIVRGRAFTKDDGPGAPPVAIVSESAARSLWPGDEPLGQRISLRNPPRSEADWLTVIGVAADIRQRSLTEAGTRAVYQSYLQVPRLPFLDHGSFVIRAAGDPAVLAPDIRAALRQADPNLPASSLVPLHARMRLQTAAPAFQARVLTMFAVVALAVTIVGLYGVLAFSVSRRAREFGIRMALGASAGRLVGVVVGGTLRVAAIGLACGIGGALAVTRLLERQLFGVTPTDPATFLSVTVLMLSAVMAAAAIPAWRAARIDPTVVLRVE